MGIYGESYRDSGLFPADALGHVRTSPGSGLICHVGIVTNWRLKYAEYSAYKHLYTDKLLKEHSMNSVRWNLAVSAETDQALRMFLASQGGGRKGDLSRFVEEAVRAHILKLSAEQAKGDSWSARAS